MNKTLIIRKHLIDTFIFTNYGIFNALLKLADSTMKEYINEDNVESLNTLYYYSQSGDKSISRMYQRIYDLNRDISDEDAMDKIAKVVIIRYGQLWNKYYSTLQTEYNPINDYKRNIIETPNITRSGSSEGSTSTSGNNEVYGFNSNNAVNDSSTSSSGSNEVTTTEKESGDRTTDIEGYYTSPISSIKNELRLRIDNQIYNQIFKDLDSLLTLPSYELSCLKNERIVEGPQGVGIEKIELTSTSDDGLTKTYTIYLTDGTTFTYEVKDGNSITKIELISTSEDTLENTYRIYFQDGTHFDYVVTNGNGIKEIKLISTSSDTLTNTYQIVFTNGTTFNYDVKNGNGIKSIVKTSTLGLVDTYTITFTDNSTSTFNVTNGEKGEQGEQGPQGIPGYVNEGAISFDVVSGDLHIYANEGEELPNYYSIDNGYIYYNFNTEGGN